MEGPRSQVTGMGLVVGSITSVQFGAAIAATLFSSIGPLGAVGLRLLGGAVVLAFVTRPWRVRWTRAALRTVLVFGVAMTVMNTTFYLSINRLPLATAVTIEFLGPLGVAVATARSWRQRGWAVPAAVGVLLLGGTLHAGNVTGVLFALAAAAGWAVYILAARRLGDDRDGLPGLCLAVALGAVVMVPIGAATAGGHLLRPGTLSTGLAVGVLSSAIPYSLDLLALRRLPTAVFGVFTSLDPAMAALAGWLVLGNHLPGGQLAGIALVVAASAGIALSASSRAGQPVAAPAGETIPSA